jgi:hypothetical protein
LTRAALGRKSRTYTGPSIREILYRDTVFLLKWFDQYVAAVRPNGTDDRDFAFLFCRRQNFLPLLAKAYFRTRGPQNGHDHD